MLRPCDANMHEYAKQHATEEIQQHAAKRETNKVVAIERHNMSWSDQSIKEERFLWFKARDKITVRVLRENYRGNYDIPEMDLQFTLGNRVLIDEYRLSDLDDYHDRYIVIGTQNFVASPLIPSFSSSAQERASPRKPIQQINRQPNSLYAPAIEKPFNARDPAERTTSPSSTREKILVGRDSSISTSLTPIRQPGFTMRPIPSHTPAPSESTESNSLFVSQSAPQPENAQQSILQLGRTTTPPRQGGIHTMTDMHDYRAMRDRATSISESGYGSASAGPAENDLPSASQDYGPRTFESDFVNSQPEETHQDIPERGVPLRTLIKNATPERLEAATRQGVRILTQIGATLRNLPNDPNAQAWLAQTNDVRTQAMKTRTIVGVVGSTGAGKSSVINAILDEERLVPTNCMRACTAVVTEISYNDDKSGSKKYRAEIEFIKPEEWYRELKVLFEEVFDQEGRISREIGNADSEAGIAYAKIRAVYNTHTREMLANTTVESLMRSKKVQSTLGTTKQINSGGCATFYDRLQHYVDSKEEIGLDNNGVKKSTTKRDFEYWPLIKVVRIYVKSEALSTGAVVVDLPGVHDSNAARAAVADDYMRQCTGLWIVAPINRAVDDKAAKNLLGDTFKRQLKYDGTYSAVTFICSKTDDISKIEATSALRLGPRMNELDDQLDEVEREERSIKARIKEAESEASDLSATYLQADEQILEWESLRARLDAGVDDVYAPIVKTKKRKRSDHSPSSRKRRLHPNDDPDDDCIEDEDSESEAEESQGDDQHQGDPLTIEDVDVRIDELKQFKTVTRPAMTERRREVIFLEKQAAELARKGKKIRAEQDIMCVEGRNEYSREAIRQDFAAGIKELDQENAAEEDPDNFDPENDIRDYEEVARSLPVFCVSSRAYQKLSGRLKKDNAVKGFTLPDQTQIPQLQAHCKKLTEKGRVAGCKRFLNSLDQLLTSLALWASEDGSSLEMDSQQRNAEKVFLANKLKHLQKALERRVTDTMDDAVETLDEQVFARFAEAGDAASRVAVLTSGRWAAPRPEGGLFWSTYKAIVRRHGVFSGASGGARDFNADLVEPIYKHLATVWEKVFQRRLPHILQSFTKGASTTIQDFHALVEDHSSGNGLGMARVGRLKTQLGAYEAIFADLATAMVKDVNDRQRDINREFTPVVASAMESAYQYCKDERGQGSFKRMKSHMESHIYTHQTSMFSEAIEQVKAELTTMCENAKTAMLDRTDQVYISMSRDYMTLIGVEVDHVRTMPREQKTMRREVDGVISESDVYFQEILDCDLTDLIGLITASGPEIEDTAGGAKEVVMVDAGLPSEVESSVEDEEVVDGGKGGVKPEPNSEDEYL